jgi:hypothetical protein
MYYLTMFNVTFLGTRSAEEAWPRVQEAAEKHGYVLAGIAKEIGVSYPTIWRWFDANPKYKRKLEELKKKAYEQ